MKAAVLVLLCASALWAQSSNTSGQQTNDEKKRTTLEESLPASSEDHAWDLGVWGGGGHTVSGGIEGVGVVNAGFRIGKILTGQLGSGWYRGNFEYAADLIPLYVFTNAPTSVHILPLFCIRGNPHCGGFAYGRGTVYGGGFNPLGLKWNFTGTRRFSPYLELNGGVLFTNKELPVATSDVNFTSGATLGVNIFTREKHAISLDLRYVHISNAGLATLNPGLNTIQGQIGYHWFK